MNYILYFYFLFCLYFNLLRVREIDKNKLTTIKKCCYNILVVSKLLETKQHKPRFNNHDYLPFIDLIVNQKDLDNQKLDQINSIPTISNIIISNIAIKNEQGSNFQKRLTNHAIVFDPSVLKNQIECWIKNISFNYITHLPNSEKSIDINLFTTKIKNFNQNVRLKILCYDDNGNHIFEDFNFGKITKKTKNEISITFKFTKELLRERKYYISEIEFVDEKIKFKTYNDSITDPNIKGNYSSYINNYK
ncbi:hypothetical protein, partial [Ureaplasma urealyticum]|uniref:hypothetical protein n=1 Tax=Ureaplasma urealyticum TaxID=2130 RepID=UPI00215C6D5F